MAYRVEIRGESFPTMAAAARAHGVTSNTVREARRTGTLDFVGLGAAALREHAKGNSRASKAVTLGGVDYPSHGDAARALGVPQCGIGRYLLTVERARERAGAIPPPLPCACPGRRRPVTVEGVTYASQRDAESALGLPPGAAGLYARVAAALSRRA